MEISELYVRSRCEEKYVNGFYPSAGNVLTSEMYLVNANFGSNSKDIEIGKKYVISLTFTQKFNFACRVIQKVNKSLFVDGTANRKEQLSCGFF